MGFWPDEDYQRGTLYQVTIGQGAKAQSGDSALRAPAGFSFRSIELPGVASTVPFDGDDKADPTNGFTIRFTAPVLPELVVPNLTFEPAVSLTRVYTYYDTFEKRFYLNVDLKPSTEYKVTIGGAIADKYGAQIGQDTVVRFKTGPLTPYAVLRTDAPVGTYNAGQPTRLFAAYRNVSKLDFELASLTLQDFYRLTGGPSSYEVFRTFTPPAPQVIRKWSVKSQAALNEGYMYDVKLGEGGALEPGIYLLTLSAPEPAATDKNYTPARHILIVTDLHVALKLGEREALAWATDLNSGQPAAGLPVSFRNSAFDAVAEEQTDAEGKAVAKMEPPGAAIRSVLRRDRRAGPAGLRRRLQQLGSGPGPMGFQPGESL